MNKISKPHIVDFLRLADQKKWFSPRIRYASVRSKPELIADLRHRFRDHLENGRIQFIRTPAFPKLRTVWIVASFCWTDCQ